MKKTFLIILTLCTFSAFAQNDEQNGQKTEVDQKWRVSIPGIILPQLVMDPWDDRQHTQHIEIHVKRNLDNKNIVGVKLATWRLFQPMGIQFSDGLLDKLDTESEFYPGHVREYGIGISYQRMLWKGLFATIEVLPQFQDYVDLDGNKIDNGFKLYNSYHLGYHLAFGGKKQFFVEPQLHVNHWMFETEAPEGFKELDDNWDDYFLFEPNIYLGFKF